MYRTDQLAILIATRNGATYLRQQLDSLLEQSFAGWVAFVHDDASGDETPRILHEYAERWPERFVIVDGPAQGSAKKNFTYLMRRVEAPYYMCCDQDDVWLPHKIQVTFDKMTELETACPGGPCLAFTDLKVVDRELRVLHESMSAYQNLDYTNLKFGRLMTQNVVSGCTMLMNRRLRDDMCRVRNLDAVIMHDWWAALIAARFGAIGAVPEGTMLYRQHGSNVVGTHDARGLKKIADRMAHLADVRRSIEASRAQAGELASVFGLGAEDTAAQYASIGQKNRLSRWRFYARTGAGKNGFVLNLAFYLLG